MGRAYTLTRTRPHRAELRFHINANQASSGRASTPKRPGLIRQSLHINVNQTSSGRASTPERPGLIRQSSILIPTRPYKAELHTDANLPTRPHRAEPPHERDQTSSGRASTSTSTRPHWAEPPHRRQPGLIRQSSTPTPTRPHRAELPHQRQPGLIRQSSAPTPTRPYWAALLCILDLKENQIYDLAHYILCSCVLFYPKVEVVGVIPLDKLHCWLSHHHFRKIRL